MLGGLLVRGVLRRVARRFTPVEEQEWDLQESDLLGSLFEYLFRERSRSRLSGIVRISAQEHSIRNSETRFCLAFSLTIIGNLP